MRKLTLLVSLLASALVPASANAALEYVGSWSVYDSRAPQWNYNYPGWRAYTGQEAAAYLFGGSPNQYVISTAGTDVADVNYKAWYDVIGVGGAEFAHDYNNKYLNQLYGPTDSYNCCGQAFVNTNAASAFIRDNFVMDVNYAFRDTSIVAINDGLTPLTPLLPGTTDLNGHSVFEFFPRPQQTVWIDPFIATGYDYTADYGILTAEFLDLKDPDGYNIYLATNLSTPIITNYKPGIDAIITFADYTDEEVLGFRVDGIDPKLNVDPFNPLAFVTGLTWNVPEGTKVTATQTPITAFVEGALPPQGAVPEPASWAMMIFGMGGVGMILRRRAPAARSAIA